MWGVVGDQPKRCDFDGDGKTDFGIWRPSDGYWWVVNSGYNSGKTNDPFTVGQYGTSNDQSHCVDSDGDGKANMIMRWFKQSKWWYKDGVSDGVHLGIQWGLPRDTTLLGGDFNGDGNDDITVVRPESFMWYHKHKESDTFTQVQWGLPGDLVPK
jgi:hypothetical protein